MQARILAEFFAGRVDAERLGSDLASAYCEVAPGTLAFVVEEEGTEALQVDRQSMIRVCDAVLGGQLEPAMLEPIGDCLLLSDAFEFEDADADLLSSVAHWWGAPEIHVPLDQVSARGFRDWLATGTNPLG